jgi:serine/threonine-protein kinase HipA
LSPDEAMDGAGPRPVMAPLRHVDCIERCPVYDLMPSTPISLERRDLALDCGDQGRYANAKNILSQHARFLLERSEAEKIANDMKAKVEAMWYDTTRAIGVSEKDAERIRGAFIYPGFSL